MFLNLLMVPRPILLSSDQKYCMLNCIICVCQCWIYLEVYTPIPTTMPAYDLPTSWYADSVSRWFMIYNNRNHVHIRLQCFEPCWQWTSVSLLNSKKRSLFPIFNEFIVQKRTESIGMLSSSSPFRWYGTATLLESRSTFRGHYLVSNIEQL